MFIALGILIVLAVALLLPLALTGDLFVFFKRYALTLAIGFAAVVVAVLVNLTAQKASLRKDLTADQKYSVSQNFINISSKLDDQVQIVYYVSSELQEFVQLKLDMTDKLNEIKSATKSAVDFKVEEVDPKDKKLREELATHGFLRQISTSKSDEMKFSILISGMKITYKAQEPVYIPQIYYANELEFQLAEKLLELHVKDSPKDKPVIAVNIPQAPMGANMPGRPQHGSGFEWLVNEHSGASINSKKFDLKQIELNQNSLIPDKTSLLLMIRPKLIDERQKYEVEKYLAEGGKVILFVSPVKVDLMGNSGTVTDTPFGLEDYLKEIGVTLGKGVLADKSHLSIQINTGTVEFPSFFIRIKPENIDQSTSLTHLMPGLCMPHPTAIFLDDAVLSKANLKSTVLAKTTEQNWELALAGNMFDFANESSQGTGAKTTPKTVFAMIKGQFPFPYEGKPVPEWPGSDKDKDKAKDKDEKPKTPATATVASTKKEGTLVICSAPEAFYQPYLEEPNLRGLIQSGNISLLLNITESMSYGDDLIQLRSKNYETRTISKLSGDQNETLRQLWKFALIAGVPVLVLLFAVYRFVFRRMNQLSYERKFSGTIGPSSFSA